MGASGAIESAATILSVYKQTLPPTLNLRDPDEGCDLDYVTVPRPYPLKSAMCVNAGFGGRYSALIFGENEVTP
jgi:3-oxoacyl-[acyl-carrier-protein] synthase II